ncbi:MAG: sensor histidine kinase, partial [Bacteroidota bacterium]
NLRRRQLAQATALEFEKEQNRLDTLALIQKMEVDSLDQSLEAQDRERTRISEDLHDSLGGTLAAIQLSLSMIQETIQASGSEMAGRMYHRAVDQIDQAVKDVRRIAHNLGDLVLDRGGLEEAIQNLCDTLEQQGRFNLSVEISGFTHHRLPSSIERNVYRVVQELFQNILKHARASEVTLQVNLIRNRLSLIMEDDGRGFDPTLKQDQGMGMRNIYSRIQKIGGDISFDSAPGEGTTVVLNVPITS